MPETIKPHPERAVLAQVVKSATKAAGEHLLEAVAADDMDEIALRPTGLLAVVDALRNAGFNHLLDIGGTDHLPLRPRFEVAYHFTSIPSEGDVTEPASLRNLPLFRLRVFPDDRDPAVQTLTHLWPSANWAEREAFDLFGIRFEGHPNLRRILNPDDYRGHPLRKDFPLRGLERRFVPGGRDGSVPPVKES